MSILEALKKIDLLGLDPNGGVLAYSTYWRPQPSNSNPEQPREKVAITSYLPTNTRDVCRCGSGKPFGDCCQSLPYWQLVCPNPGIEQGHSLFTPQSATFTNIPADGVHDFLQKDACTFCVDETKRGNFWLYWGYPALQTPLGILCFGDFELKKKRTLLITALSNIRMKTLLDLISPLNLGAPQMHREPIIRPDKPIRRSVRRVRGKRRWV